MLSACGFRTAVAAPPRPHKMPEFGGDPPSADGRLRVTAEVCGTQLPGRLADWMESKPDASPADGTGQT